MEFDSGNSTHPTRQDKMAILGEILPIFRLWYPICRFSAHMFMEFAHFCLFLPIFCLKWYPILVINSSMITICHFSAHMFTDSTYFLPNLPPIFAGPALPGIGHVCQVLLYTFKLKTYHKTYHSIRINLKNSNFY